ncbi:hypothetical protein BBF96_07150 [Anoxybacter fermentans]|uniref:Stage II sporulation protein P n=1 Tax=Anoxybacter fermentans TaxID=1323375 RepID=A0A3Q9HQL8_9FIRM|nr:stage II sporulation protein P [Anoxybacter fermentans]AZR73180.1 hypothetical protein BBF96_07150 [Anoxybacter fermentans]
MLREKKFQIILILYIIVFFLIVGLIIHKFISYPEQLTSLVVQFNLEVSEKVAPEKLVHQIYKWMQLDSERSRSIIAEGIPALDGKIKKRGFMELLVEPKNLINYFVYWTVGIDFKRPLTYLTSSIPSLKSHKNIRTVAALKKKEKVPAALAREKKVIRSEKGTIYLDIPEEEMLHVTKTAEPRVLKDKIINTSKRAIKRKPRVLIYHTHTSETYIDDSHPQDNLWHTLLPHLGNIVIVGDALTEGLKKLGVEVYHDTTSYDGEVFANAYNNARKGIQKLLREQSFDIVLDLHRDGKNNALDIIRDDYIIKIKGKKAARVLLIVTQGKLDYLSKEEQREAHPHWETNFKFCTALAAKMQEMYPGLLRRVENRENKRYNQDLHPHALLIEVGYQGNTTAEAVYTGQLLAEIIAELLKEEPIFLLD